MITAIAAAVLFAVVAAAPAEKPAPEHVTFPTSDGGVLVGDVYGKGERGLVLAHGGRFDKESWAKQAEAFAAAGFRVLAFDFRGYGKSRGPGQADPLSAPLELDVLAAVRYLRDAGAKSVAIVGGSMGGSAGADAAALSDPGTIEVGRPHRKRRRPVARKDSGAQARHRHEGRCRRQRDAEAAEDPRLVREDDACRKRS